MTDKDEDAMRPERIEETAATVRDAEVEAAAAALEAAVLVMRGLNDPDEARSVSALSALMEAWSRRAAERRARAQLGEDATLDTVIAAADEWRGGLRVPARADDDDPGGPVLQRRAIGSMQALSPQARVVRARAFALAVLGSVSDDLAAGGNDVAAGAIGMLAKDLGEQLNMIAVDLDGSQARQRGGVEATGAG